MSQQLKFKNKSNISETEIRTRFAPSPTGTLHLGSARTALFNYLFAKSNNGKFILRIEDSDAERSKKEFENDIIENLKWLEINWDEGPTISDPAQNTVKKYIGEHGSYRQSERLLMYEKYIKKLLENERVYHCFCKEEELEEIKAEQLSRGETPKYGGRCRNLSIADIQNRLKNKENYVIRFKTPAKIIEFNDLIRGKISFDANLFGDIVIAKNYNLPLYNLAVVIDDFEMKINYVIRGEDHISNTPKQIIIQEALNMPRPNYGHLPLILGTDKTKLSKRHGALSIKEYKNDGFLKEAIINFIAFLGWNPKTDKEIFSLKELENNFSLENIQKAGAVFNIKKLEWLNTYYIKHKSLDEISEIGCQFFTEKKDAEKIKQIINLERERIKKLSELPLISKFFFKLPEYDKELLKWRDMNDDKLINNLKIIKDELQKLNDNLFSLEEIKVKIDKLTQNFETGEIYWPLRVALSGQKESPGPIEIAQILGKEETINRLDKAIKKYNRII